MFARHTYSNLFPEENVTKTLLITKHFKMLINAIRFNSFIFLSIESVLIKYKSTLLKGKYEFGSFHEYHAETHTLHA